MRYCLTAYKASTKEAGLEEDGEFEDNLGLWRESRGGERRVENRREEELRE